MNDPKSVSWLNFYIARPIKNIRNVLGKRISTIWIKLKGGWYCAYCHKVHSRRVYKYSYIDTRLGIVTGPLHGTCNEHDKLVCSLGRDAALHESWRPLNNKLGDKRRLI